MKKSLTATTKIHPICYSNTYLIISLLFFFVNLFLEQNSYLLFHVGQRVQNKTT